MIASGDMLRKVFCVVIVIIGIISFFGCGISHGPADQTSVKTSLPRFTTQTIMEITVAPMPLEDTQAASSNPTQLSNSTHTITTTASPAPSSLPIMPTLPSEIAEEFVNKLFLDNQGCLLPCWWGFTPGLTSWYEARHLLVQFAEFNKLVDQDNPDFYMDILVPVPEEVSNIPLTQIYEVENGIIISINVNTGNVYSYKLSNLLQTYGPPEEIWISTYSNEYPEGVLPFLISLFYPDKGILVFYFAEADFIGNMVRACNLDRPPSGLGLWAPEKKTMKYIEAARFFGQNPDEPGIKHLRLEEATGLSIERFYEIFKHSASLECIETPINLWPEQF